MKTEFAACEYCGQYNTVSVPDNATQAEAKALFEALKASDETVKNCELLREQLEEQWGAVMKSVLISIQPRFCELIASGKKTIEIRKSKPKLEAPFKCYIYCTKKLDKEGNGYFHGKYFGKVIGEFVCNNIISLGNVSTDAWEHLHGSIHEWHKHIVTEKACLTEKEIHDYGGRYAWDISALVIYDKPKELSEFYRKCEKYRCENCEHLKYQGVNASEYDYDCEFLESKIPITRPPQSWCYVDSE